MLCSSCADVGLKVEMEHRAGVQQAYDPAAIDGYSEYPVCGYFCTCGHMEECDGHHKDEPESEEPL